MTEISYFWNGLSIGDAVYAKYTENIMSDFIKYMLLYDSGLEGVVATKTSSPFYNGNLKVWQPSSITIQVDPGHALVDGSGYSLSDVETFTFSASGEAWPRYYRIVLRKDYSAKTVRLIKLGPGDTTYPELTQVPDLYWEISLAKFITYGGLPESLVDERTFVKSPVVDYLTYRQGGSIGPWNESGEENYRPEIPFYQAGVITSDSVNTGKVEVTFPTRFEQAPMVKTACKYGSNYYISCILDDVNSEGFSGVTRRGSDLAIGGVDVHWVAVGPP